MKIKFCDTRLLPKQHAGLAKRAFKPRSNPAQLLSYTHVVSKKARKTRVTGFVCIITAIIVQKKMKIQICKTISNSNHNLLRNTLTVCTRAHTFVREIGYCLLYLYNRRYANLLWKFKKIIALPLRADEFLVRSDEVCPTLNASQHACLTNRLRRHVPCKKQIKK